MGDPLVSDDRVSNRGDLGNDRCMNEMLLGGAITSSVLLRDASTQRESREPPEGRSPVLVCRGPHTGRCPLLERNGIRGPDGGDHGLVVELDVTLSEHRAALRTLRTSISDETALVVLPRTGRSHTAAC